MKNQMKNKIIQKVEELKNYFLTPNRDSVSMKGAVCVVGALHIAVIVGIMMASSAAKARALAADDKKFLDNAPFVGVEEPKDEKQQKPNEKAKVEKPKVEVKPQNKTNPNLTTEYIVKDGDSFGKIVAKYKLNGKKFQSINNIKDTNKLYVGQKLKLM
jgi:LysM repeat protein